MKGRLFPLTLALLFAGSVLACKASAEKKRADNDESAEEDPEPKKKKKRKKAKESTDTASSAGDARPSAAPTASASSAPPAAETKRRFPREGLGLPDSCTSEVWVLIEPPGRNVRESYYLVQGLTSPAVAHSGSKPGEFGVFILAKDSEHASGGGGTVFARCSDAETCYELAAFLAHARSFPKPKVSCGKPAFAGEYESAGSWNIPIPSLDATEISPSCARIAGCRYDKDPSLPKGLVESCARSPGSQKLSCAQKKTCADVLSCIDGG